MHRRPRDTRSAVRLLSTGSLAALLLSAGVPAHAWSPQNRPQREPAVANFDGPVNEAPMIGLPPHRRLGPVGTLGVLSVANIQSEMSIAVAGDTIIMGANDFRGATSSSGVFWSTDAGVTFNDGGQLPIGTGKNVFGDPCLAVYTPPGGGPSVWYYSSIFLNSASRQTLCVHRSVDGGQTWAGPFEVASATAVNHSADKEWLTVDPETGRVFISWTDFPTGTNLMKVTYSDTQGASWSAAATVGTNGQGSSIAVSPSSSNVYVTWYGFSGASTALWSSRSTNNGTSWQGPTLVHTYNQVLPAYGFDRFNSYPSVAVNPSNGDVVVVHSASQTGSPSGDLQDVYFSKSSDGGQTWSSVPPVLNAFPGTDRPQVFPTIACASNGREDVFWYDQSAGSGNDDWTDLFYTYSTDFGTTWSSPVPVNSTPWHNESGNNFGAPHQGDYIDAATTTATLNAYATAASFNDPNPLGNSADALSALVQNLGQVAPLRVRPGSVTFTDQGCTANDGLLVAGEVVTLTVPLQNIGRGLVTGISATLSAITAGVTVLGNSSTYPNLASGASGNNALSLTFKIEAGYVCGQDVKLHLDIAAAGLASTYVEFALRTGVVATTTALVSENFDALTLPNIPAGWSRVNGCTACPVLNWRSIADATAPSQPNAMFASDSTVATFGRLYGTTLTIAGGVTYVDVDYDIKYNTEAQDARTGFDGTSFEYSVDGSGSHFATADAVDFTPRYDHYLTRNTGGTSNGDRHGWAGDSGGWKHVHLRIPGLAGHTFLPRFSMASDASAGGAGAWIDNVAINAVTMDCGACTPTAVGEAGESIDARSLNLRTVGANPFSGATSIAYTLPRRGAVRLDVFNLAGEKVRTLVSGPQNAGSYAVPFRLHAPGEPGLAAGVYLVRLSGAGQVNTMRVTALR